jgi:hypothetical protein
MRFALERSLLRLPNGQRLANPLGMFQPSAFTLGPARNFVVVDFGVQRGEPNHREIFSDRN